MARAPCALCDAVELHGLVASAGFRNVRVRPTIATTKLPLPDQFVPGHLAALPMAQAIARLAPDRGAALLAEVTETLRPYVDGEQVIIRPVLMSRRRMPDFTRPPDAFVLLEPGR